MHRLRKISLFLCFLFLIINGSAVTADFSAPGDSGFGDVVFCEDVSYSGDPLYISDIFPISSPQVLVYIPYSNMEDDESWGMYWTVNGEEYADERDQVWDQGSDGWITYDVTDDGILIEGVWQLDLYRGRDLVRTVSFTVSGEEGLREDEESEPVGADSAGFGRIRFSEGVTDEHVPMQQGEIFTYGVHEIYVVIPFFGMEDGISWTREWLLDGEEFVVTDDIWSEGVEGITSRSVEYEDESPLDPGTYTLNLYIDDQLARSASFDIINPDSSQSPTELQQVKPEDLIDEELLPAWQLLADSPTEVVREIAQLVPENNIEIRLVDEASAIAVYRYEVGSSEIGNVLVKKSDYDKYSWVEVAATIAHELTHSMQHREDGEDFHCSIENEYYAYIVEFYVLLDNGREDLIYEKWSGLFDDNWKFDSSKLWSVLKEAYNTCPDY